MSRAVWAAAIAVVASGTLVAMGARPAASQQADLPAGPPLALQTQSFAVTPGASAHFEFVVNEDVPEIIPPTTTTTTTTTTVVDAPVTFPADHPYAGAVIPEDLLDEFPELATTVPAATDTPPSTVPAGPVMTVRIAVHRLIEDRQQVERAYDGRPGLEIDSVDYPLADVATLTDGVRQMTLDVPIGGAAGRSRTDGDLDLPDVGLYPVSVTILRDDVPTGATEVTFVERLPTGSSGLGPFRMAVVAGVTDPGPVVTEQELADGRTELGALGAVAGTVESGITAAVPPELVNQLVAGDRALAAELGGALSASELIELPAQPLDASSAAEADAANSTLDPDDPTSGLLGELAQLRRDGTRLLDDALPGLEPTSSVWLTDAPITAAGAQALSDLGVGTLVLPYEHYAELPGSIEWTDTSLLASAPLDDATIDVALIDPVNRLLDPERERVDTPYGDAVHLMASMSAIRHQLGPDVRGFVLARPDLGVPDAEVLGHLGQIAASNPDFEFVHLSELAERTNPFVVNGDDLMIGYDTEPQFDLATRVTRVDQIRLTAIDAGSMLPADDVRPARWTTTLADATSTGLTDAEAAAGLDTIAAEVDEVRGAVGPPEAYPFTLGSKRATVPLRIPNNSSTALDVVVRLSAEKLELPEGGKRVTLDPGTVTEVEIEVLARSNGRFPVVAEVFSPLGNRLTAPVELQARVTTLSGVGWVVTGGLVLALGSWWYSHLRQRHRARRREIVAASVGRHPVGAPGPVAPSRGLPFPVELVTDRVRRGSTTIDAHTDSFTDLTAVDAETIERAGSSPVPDPSDERGSVPEP